jgi:hypothetical protein
MHGDYRTVTAAAVLFALVLIVRLLGHRKAYERYNRELCDRLLPFTGSTASSDFDHRDAIWNAMGRSRGIWTLFWAAGAISTIACGIARRYPAAETAAQDIFLAAIEVRILSFLALLEALICSVIPEFPRAIAWTVVRLYCDIALTLEAAQSISSVC